MCVWAKHELTLADSVSLFVCEGWSTDIEADQTCKLFFGGTMLPKIAVTLEPFWVTLYTFFVEKLVGIA